MAAPLVHAAEATTSGYRGSIFAALDDRSQRPLPEQIGAHLGLAQQASQNRGGPMVLLQQRRIVPQPLPDADEPVIDSEQQGA